MRLEDYQNKANHIRHLAKVANADPERKDHRLKDLLREAVGPAQEAGSFFMVGTTKSQSFHLTARGFKFFSLDNVPGWQYLEDAHPNEQRILVVTKLARVAIMSALFGDINSNTTTNYERGRNASLANPPRQRLPHIITDKPRPHYGWDISEFSDEGVTLHALPELINAAPGILSGAIDVVGYWDPTTDECPPEPIDELGVGMYGLRFPGQTIATFHVTGRDRPKDIAAIRYPAHGG